MDERQELEPEQSRAFLERKTLLELEREVVRLRHAYKMTELDTQRKNDSLGHDERMAEIRLKNANIQRTFDAREKFKNLAGTK